MKVFFVTRHLAFGSMVTTSSDVERLRGLGITHIINLMRNRNSKEVRTFEWLWLPFRDDKKPRPHWFYKKALRFHKRALRFRDRKVFVMCHYGVSRSASLTYFLLRASGFREDRAAAMILRVRPCAKIFRAYRLSGEKYLASNR